MFKCMYMKYVCSMCVFYDIFNFHFNKCTRVMYRWLFLRALNKTFAHFWLIWVWLRKNQYTGFLRLRVRKTYNSFTITLKFWRCLGIHMDRPRATFQVLKITISSLFIRTISLSTTISKSKCLAGPKKNIKIWRN